MEANMEITILAITHRREFFLEPFGIPFDDVNTVDVHLLEGPCLLFKDRKNFR